MLVAIFSGYSSRAEEKFLSIKGTLLEEESKTALTNYTIKVVQDRLDSTMNLFSKSEFQVWAPANRRSVVYFEKEGYVTKQVYIDASYIPSIAFKEKQQIELQILMTPLDKVGKRNFSKPIMTAQYDAADNAFWVKEEEVARVSSVPENYNPPFPTPVDTYKGVQPTANDLLLTTTYNKDKVKSGSEFSRIIQGVLFADMNYCFFNERTNDANVILSKLAAIDADNWGGMKPFDSPEYGKIIMRTLNREQSADTLFALGAFIETSRLIFENFTSDTKVMVHLKKLKDVLNAYQPINLTSSQNTLVETVREFLPLIVELEKKYTDALRIKADFDLNADDVFISLRQKNLEVYQFVIE